MSDVDIRIGEAAPVVTVEWDEEGAVNAETGGASVTTRICRVPVVELIDFTDRFIMENTGDEVMEVKHRDLYPVIRGFVEKCPFAPPKISDGELDAIYHSARIKYREFKKKQREDFENTRS